MSKTRILLTVVSALAFLCFVSGVATADQAGSVQVSAAPASGELIPGPEQPILEPGDEPKACPVRDEDLGKDASQIDTSYLPQAMIFAAEKANRWDGGTCNESLCCGDMHCQPPYVPAECASTCNPNTWICDPV